MNATMRKMTLRFHAWAKGLSGNVQTLRSEPQATFLHKGFACSRQMPIKAFKHANACANQGKPIRGMWSSVESEELTKWCNLFDCAIFDCLLCVKTPHFACYALRIVAMKL